MIEKRKLFVVLRDGKRIQVDEEIIEKYKIGERGVTPFSSLPIEREEIK